MEEPHRTGGVLGARVLTSLRTSAAFPSNHPLHAGPPLKFINDFALKTISDSDVILSLDWIDLAGILKQVWKSGPVPAKIIQVSVDVQVHNGWSMDHLGLPPADLNVLAEPDVATVALLAELKRTRRKRPAARAITQSASHADAPPSASAHRRAAVNAIAAHQDTCLIRVNLDGRRT
jgi:thiamine pyrophosphate-dependent acetolactate synthase large subunit-like protein